MRRRPARWLPPLRRCRCRALRRTPRSTPRSTARSIIRKPLPILRQPSKIIGITPRPLDGGRGVFFGVRMTMPAMRSTRAGTWISVVAIKALILGVVEGLTEFLPVSSTGHLIVVGSLLNWNDEKGKLFEIVIQFAAILAVCWLYRQRLWTVIATLPRERKSRRFTLNLVLAFLPAARASASCSSAPSRITCSPPVPVAHGLHRRRHRHSLDREPQARRARRDCRCDQAPRCDLDRLRAGRCP